MDADKINKKRCRGSGQSGSHSDKHHQQGTELAPLRVTQLSHRSLQFIAKRRVAVGALIAVAVLCPIQAPHASEFREPTAPISLETHASFRPASPSVQGRELLGLNNDPWTPHSGGGGASVCNPQVAVLPQDNPTMRAIALAAMASGQQLSIVVDDTQVVFGNVCQVTLLTIMAS